jgi:hypothetical protein
VATELVVKLRVSGDKDVDAALKRVGQAAQDAGVKLTPMNQGLGRASEQARVAIRAAGDLAQTLAGTSALLSVVSRGNEELRDRLEKATVGLTLASTAINVFRNAAQLATGATVALRVAVVALSGPVGWVVAGITALVAVAGVLIKRHMDAKRAAEEHASALDEAAASAARFTSEGRGLTHRQRELQSQLEDTSGATEKARQVIEGMAEADRKAGQAAAERARAAREAAEALQMEIAAERLLDEVTQVAIPRAQALAAQIKGLAFDARDAAGGLRETAQAIEDISEIVDRSLGPLSQYRALILDARDAGMQFGKSTAAGAREAQTVLEDVEAAQRQAGHLQLQGILRNEEAMKQSAQSAKSAWVSGIDGILIKMGVLRETSGNIWDAIKNAAISALAKIVASAVWDAIAARFKGLSAAGGFKISSLLSAIPVVGPILGGIAGILGFEHGGSFIARGPTPIMTGEGHEPELVQVTPFSRLGRSGGGEVHFHLHSPTFLGSKEDVRRWFESVAGSVFREQYAR